MQEDLAKFNDLDSLKRKAERRKQQLIVDKNNMSKRKQITQIEIQTLQYQFEAIQKQLQDHDTHQQVRSSLRDPPPPAFSRTVHQKNLKLLE